VAIDESHQHVSPSETYSGFPSPAWREYVRPGHAHILEDVVLLCVRAADDLAVLDQCIAILIAAVENVSLPDVVVDTSRDVLPLVSSFHVRRISVRVGDRIIGRHVRITVDDALYPITPSSSVRQRGVNTRRAKLSGNQADRRTHRTRRPVSFIASEKEQLL